MELIAEKRGIFGKKTKNLRKESKIPSVIFGKGMDSISLSIDRNAFIKVFKEAGETTLVDVEFNGDSQKVLINDIQFDPITDRILHVGFYKVDLTERTTVPIPVEVIGDEENELVKSGEAIVLTLLNEVEVEALPADLPHKFEVDISGLGEIGAGVTVGELNYDHDKVSIVDLEADELVVKLDYAEIQEVEEEEEVSEEELIEGMEATEETAKEGEEEGAEGSSEKSQEKKKEEA